MTSDRPRWPHEKALPPRLTVQEQVDQLLARQRSKNLSESIKSLPIVPPPPRNEVE